LIIKLLCENIEIILAVIHIWSLKITKN